MTYVDIVPGGGVTTYSRKKDGSKTFRISGSKVCNFKVVEFACKDGSDPIKIDADLVISLQQIRDRFGAVTINSAYRNAEYNKKIGGASRSQHIYGKAADIVVKGQTPLTIARYAEKELEKINGIGLYKGFTHVDTRKNKSYWDSTSGKEVVVSTFYPGVLTIPSPILRNGSSGTHVRYLQECLNALGASLVCDGRMGIKTVNALKDFQKRAGIKIDGIYGNASRDALKRAISWK